MNIANLSSPRRSTAAQSMTCVIFGAFFLAGCTSAEKEQEPVVTVQVTPAQRGSISQVISSEAVVFPLEQATVSPKITAPITEFKVQRGSHVKKGQLLAVLENKDLAGQAEASKGNFEQAEAGYVTSVDSSNSPTSPKSAARRRSRKSGVRRAAENVRQPQRTFSAGRDSTPRSGCGRSRIGAGTQQNDVAQKQLADLQRLGKEQALKSAHGSRLSAEGRCAARKRSLATPRFAAQLTAS